MKKTKPRILWLHSHFLYWMGGTKYIFEVIKRLNHEYDVTVVVENASAHAAKQYREQGVTLISLNKISTTSILYWLTFPFQVLDTYMQIKRRALRVDVTISSMFPMNIVAACLTPRPLQLCFEPFAFFHDPDFQKGFPIGKYILLKLLRFLYGRWDIRATRRARSIITLNQVTQKTIQEIYKRESIPVYTGIDAGHFRRYVSPEIKKKYEGLEVIVHSTDYTPVKGTDRMIEIFSRVKKVRPRAHLLITTTIDDQTSRERYEQLATQLGVRGSIEFLGFVAYDILPQLYSLAKVLVQCSYSERSGTTSMALPVKEAMACGTAAIRSPVTTEDVEDGVTGYLVDPRDQSLMVERILQVLDFTPAGYKSLSRRAREKIVSLYTWDQTAKRIMSIINSTWEK